MGIEINTTLYVVYVNGDGESIYYMGSTFFNQSKWSDDIEDAFYFNHEPRPYEITEILENSTSYDFGLDDILIKPLLVSINEMNKNSG